MNQTVLLELSYWLLYSALALYVLAFVSFALDLARRTTWSQIDEAYRPGLSLRLGGSFSLAGLILHTGAIISRGIVAGRVPWDNLFGFALISTAVVVAVFLVTLLKVDLRFVGTFVLGLVIILLGGATVLYDVPIVPLAPPLQSGWLIFHVFVAALGLGFFGLGGALSVVQLLRQRYEHRGGGRVSRGGAQGAHVGEVADTGADAAANTATDGTAGVATGGTADGVTEGVAASGVAPASAAVLTEVAPAPASAPAKASLISRFLATFPLPDTLEQLAYRVNIVGFVFWTFTLIAGAIWAEAAWGRYWGWDTKEVWTFIIWTIYAGYIHARSTRGWRGTPSAWLSIIGVAAVLFNATIVNQFFKGLHSYSGL